MPAAITIAPLDAETRAEVERRYNTTTDADTRLRYHIILLADYLARVTGITVDPETVRLYLHAHDYVCKRPTWTLKRKAEGHEGSGGNA